MSEDTTKGVESQNVADSENSSEDKSQNQVEKNSNSESPKEGSKEYNFARLREKAETACKKNDQLEKEIMELKETISKRENSTLSVEEDEISKLSPDDILTVNQAYKLSEKQAKKIVGEILEKKERDSLPEKTRSKFNDFDEIMTTENIKKLEIDEPGLAAACMKAPNPWEATYKILKKFVITQENLKSNKNEEKLKENFSKPGSLNSIGKNKPLSNANVWSEASKEELYKEMLQASRQVH
jgi:hypothetical protein